MILQCITSKQAKSFRPEGGDVDISAGDVVIGYKIGSFYITNMATFEI